MPDKTAPKLGRIPLVGIPDDSVLSSLSDTPGQQLVFAISAAGGYATHDNPHTTEQSTTEGNNDLKLRAAIFASLSSRDAISLAGPPAKDRKTPQVNAYSGFLNKRLGMFDSSLVYQFVRQEILIHDAEVEIHNLARNETILSLHDPATTDYELWRIQCDAELNPGSYDDYRLQCSAEIDRVARLTRQGLYNASGGVTAQVSDSFGTDEAFELRRLEAIRAKLIAVPPTRGSFQGFHEVPPARYKHSLLSRKEKHNIWLERWAERKLTIFWEFRDCFDILATFDPESNPEMEAFGKHQFANMADSYFWNLIRPVWSNELSQLTDARCGLVPIPMKIEYGEHEASMNDFPAAYNEASLNDPHCGHYGEQYVITDLSKVRVRAGSRSSSDNEREEDWRIHKQIQLWKNQNGV